MSLRRKRSLHKIPNPERFEYGALLNVARRKSFDQETPSRNGYASFRRGSLVLSSKLSRAFRTPKGFVWPRGGAFAAATAASLDFLPISGL